MYVYIRSEKAQPAEGKWPATNDLWTVGFYKPDGKFEPESDHTSSADAAERVRYLNGGNAESDLENSVKIWGSGS